MSTVELCTSCGNYHYAGRCRHAGPVADQWKLEHGGLTAGQVEAYRAELETRIIAADQDAVSAVTPLQAVSFRWECRGLQMALTLLNLIDVPLSHPTEGADQEASSVSEAIAATNDTMRQLRDAG